ncbi:hypothetical protein L596_006890 [Steinernema carpocapsae]|uniref:Uncharacterized protein n=1 Tax=Steinernema carpocapsae TaxID=34508 RepID=A0A4U5P7Z3_STECR|nr:hypothetical protein L596_006890 [Steinernema carpocapsae]
MRNRPTIITEENLVQRKASFTQDKPLLEEDHQNEPCSSQEEGNQENGDLVSSPEKTTPLSMAPSQAASSRPTILPHKENVTVFSIHLVRSEDAGRSSLLREKGRQTENGPRPVSYSFEKVSANIPASLNSTLQLDASFEAEEVASAATNTSTESTLSPQRTSTPLMDCDGNAPSTSTKALVVETSEKPVVRSVPRRIANAFLSVLLISLLLIACCIALFESQSEASWMEQFPALESARHQFYEPCRHHALNLYRRYISK